MDFSWTVIERLTKKNIVIRSFLLRGDLSIQAFKFKSMSVLITYHILLSTLND